jgi:Ca2+-binding RTX toxin-like protein
VATTSIPGGGNHNVTVYGNGTVIAGNGNNTVRIQGSGRVVVGNGNDTIAIMGNGTVAAGSGNNRISVLGAGQVSVGGGHDTITMYGSGQIVQKGVLGKDVIQLGSGNDTVLVQGQATVNTSSLYGFAFRGFGVNTGPMGVPFALGGRGIPNNFRAVGSATVVGGQLQVTHSHGITQELAASGRMTLQGGYSATHFIGGAGTTLMKGGSGHDTFVGGSGHDTMMGIGSANVFEFLASGKGGQHVISNFVSGDQLNVEGHSLSYLLSHHEVTTHGGNSFISIDGGKTTIELQGVAESGGIRAHYPMISPHDRYDRPN